METQAIRGSEAFNRPGRCYYCDTFTRCISGKFKKVIPSIWPHKRNSGARRRYFLFPSNCNL